jgi:D-lyxose ketol-isomerase
MKRSEINRHIAFAKEFFARHNFKLPPFAFWTPEEWKAKGPEADEIRSRRLGWDLTDFNLGKFPEMGLTLFTVRNGNLKDPENKKVYAEKIMLALDSQVTPFHFHWMKTEDIINRAGGELVVELYNADRQTEDFTDAPVVVTCDGVRREVKAGGSVILKPGESITLLPYQYHKFYPRKGSGPVMIGEVSSVNDDATDNRFKDPLPRFPSVEEDEPPVHLLCNEYPPAR